MSSGKKKKTASNSVELSMTGDDFTNIFSQSKKMC